MFFSINALEGFILDLDGFLTYEDRQLNTTPDIRAVVRSAQSDVTLASDFVKILDVLQGKKIALVSSCLVKDLHAIFQRAGVSSNQFSLHTSENLLQDAYFAGIVIKAVKGLGLRPERCAYIAAGYKHLHEAHEANLGTILYLIGNPDPQVRLKNFQEFPDYIVDEPRAVSEIISGQLVGYSAEVQSIEQDFLITPHTSRRMIYKYFEVPNGERSDTPIRVMGRLFNQSDPRSKRHALSIRIHSSKAKPESQAALFADMFLTGIRRDEVGEIGIITGVPARPTEQSRFSIYLSRMKSRPSFKSMGFSPEMIQPDALKCIRDYPKLRLCRSASERREAVKDAFLASDFVKGRTVVVIEDVMSTGSTILEAIRALFAAGAKKIIPVILAYHPLGTLSGADEMNITCVKCGHIVVPRCASNETRNEGGGGIFFGCQPYNPNDKHPIRGFTEVVRLLNVKWGDKALAEAKIFKADIPF